MAQTRSSKSIAGPCVLAACLALIIAPRSAAAHAVAQKAQQPAPHGGGGNHPAANISRPATVAHAAGARSVAPRAASGAAPLRGGVVHHAAPVAAYAAVQARGPELRNGSAVLATTQGAPAWDKGWHNDNRYDWVGWRAAHRATFHPDYYIPPFGGYAYAPVGIGALLAVDFLGEQYWIADPSIYHLPPAEDPYRWVRYYNDCLLVDIDTGAVVDVVRDVFW